MSNNNFEIKKVHISHKLCLFEEHHNFEVLPLTIYTKAASSFLQELFLLGP